jgi:hypothetical protein
MTSPVAVMEGLSCLIVLVAGAALVAVLFGRFPIREKGE